METLLPEEMHTHFGILANDVFVTKHRVFSQIEGGNA